MKAKENQIKVVIVVSGGVVQEILSSDESLRIELLDYDNIEEVDKTCEKEYYQSLITNMKRVL